MRSNVRAIATEQFEISIEQFHILRHIRKGFQSVSELAGVRQISRPAVSQTVEALVEKGFISRHPDANDRRYVHLQLTPDGENLLNEIFRANREWMAEKLLALDPQELENIRNALETLQQLRELF